MLIGVANSKGGHTRNRHSVLTSDKLIFPKSIFGYRRDSLEIRMLQSDSSGHFDDRHQEMEEHANV
jgi:hypothetical protein